MSMRFTTRAVLTGMLERTRGAVLNIIRPTYTSGAKAFVNQFSQDLEAGFFDQGIIFQALAPWICCEQDV